MGKQTQPHSDGKSSHIYLASVNVAFFVPSPSLTPTQMSEEESTHVPAAQAPVFRTIRCLSMGGVRGGEVLISHCQHDSAGEGYNQRASMCTASLTSLEL